VEHQGLILSLELHCERPKSVQKILQRQSSQSLLYAEKIERDRRLGLINNELFPEQSKKLIERGYVAIRKANKQL